MVWRVHAHVPTTVADLIRDCNEINEKKLKWDDPKSPFTGSSRNYRVMWIFELENRSGKTKWYTDVFGLNLSDKPIQGGIEQFISEQKIATGTWSGPTTNYRLEPNSGVHLPN